MGESLWIALSVSLAKLRWKLANQYGSGSPTSASTARRRGLKQYARHVPIFAVVSRQGFQRALFLFVCLFACCCKVF